MRTTLIAEYGNRVKGYEIDNKDEHDLPTFRIFQLSATLTDNTRVALNTVGVDRAPNDSKFFMRTGRQKAVMDYLRKQGTEDLPDIFRRWRDENSYKDITFAVSEDGKTLTATVIPRSKTRQTQVFQEPITRGGSGPNIAAARRSIIKRIKELK
jgi:hypothetical protein